jgi:hypothetical protein
LATTIEWETGHAPSHRSGCFVVFAARASGHGDETPFGRPASITVARGETIRFVVQAGMIGDLAVTP